MIRGSLRRQGFAQDWVLSGNEDNCMTGYFHKSSLEERETRERLRLYLVKKKQSFLLGRIGGTWSFLWFEQCLCFCCVLLMVGTSCFPLDSSWSHSVPCLVSVFCEIAHVRQERTKAELLSVRPAPRCQGMHFSFSFLYLFSNYCFFLKMNLSNSLITVIRCF